MVKPWIEWVLVCIPNGILYECVYREIACIDILKIYGDQKENVSTVVMCFSSANSKVCDFYISGEKCIQQWWWLLIYMSYSAWTLSKLRMYSLTQKNLASILTWNPCGEQSILDKSFSLD